MRFEVERAMSFFIWQCVWLDKISRVMSSILVSSGLKDMAIFLRSKSGGSTTSKNNIMTVKSVRSCSTGVVDGHVRRQSQNAAICNMLGGASSELAPWPTHNLSLSDVSSIVRAQHLGGRSLHKRSSVYQHADLSLSTFDQIVGMMWLAGRGGHQLASEATLPP